MGRLIDAGVRRLCALLVASASSGLLPLAASLAPEPEHHCACRHGPGEVCRCPACQRAGAKARRDRLAAMPPCHRAAALAAEDRAREGFGSTFTGCCPAPEPEAAGFQFPAPCVRPPSRAVPAPGPEVAVVPRAPDPPRDVDRSPPTPPPRAA